MYRIRKEESAIFKDFKSRIYEKYIGVASTYICSILNGNRHCTVSLAKAIISTRFNISFIDEKMEEYLEKYFAKEK